jgi:hypothetical protein
MWLKCGHGQAPEPPAVGRQHNSPEDPLMIITVEVGTQEEKSAIHGELEDILGILDNSEYQLLISQVIVAKDIDTTINELLETKSYQSTKTVGSNLRQLEAKVINSKKGIVLIISPTIFTNNYDPIIRSNIYFHEIVHCINTQKLPPEPSGRSAKNIYLRLLRLLLDEYIADIKSYNAMDTCWKTKSDLWNNSILKRYIGYCALINDKSIIEELGNNNDEIEVNKDILLYLKNISPIIDDVLISAIHAIALVDCYPDICKYSEIECSPLINMDTVKLIEYIRDKHNKKDFNLDDGGQVVINAVNNFGFTLRDEEGKLLCKIIS